MTTGVERIHLYGASAGRPNANTVIAGTEYWDTDSGVLSRSDGADWVVVFTGAASASVAWELAGDGYTATGIWDQSVDGTTASPLTFTGLGSYSEIMVLIDSLDKTVSSTVRCQVGYDGPTWLSTAEYVVLEDNGDENTSSTLSFNSGADTAAVSAWLKIMGFSLAAVKPVMVMNRAIGSNAWFINDVNPLNRIRVQTSTETGNFNGGAVYVYGKP